MERARLDLTILAALALLCNLAYFAYSSGDFFFPDSATYIAPARAMLEGRGFMRDARLPETFRTPGYPLLLMPFIAASANFAAYVVIAQHLLNALLAMAVYWFARRRFPRRVAFVAGVVFAIDPATVHYANKILTETVFTALLFAATAMVVSQSPFADTKTRALMLGVLCGVLVLIRPVAIAYFVVVAAFLAWQRRRGIVLFVIAALVLPLGWVARNGVRTGVFALADVAGVNMLQHRAAASLAIFDDYAFKDALHDRQDELTSAADDEIERRYHVDAATIPPALHAKYYGQIGRRIMLQHPLGLAALTARGVLVNLFDSDWDALGMLSRVPDALVELTLSAWTYAISLVAVFGLLVLSRRDPPLALFFAATIAYFIVISAGSEAEARFRVPVVPLMSIAAAMGVEAMKRAASPGSS